MIRKEEMFCSICGEPNEKWSDDFYGHNAEPISGGRCCGECNENFVVPARMMLHAQHQMAH
jgi:hypothetical protein